VFSDPNPTPILGGDLSRVTDPRVSPLHADHFGLAPAIIGIGHHDPLLDQDLAYAAALRAAGVPTVLREYPDLIHGFFGMGGVSASAGKAADELCRDLREMLVDT
jgi:acetyl esterase